MKKLWAAFIVAAVLPFFSCSRDKQPENIKAKIVIIIDDMGRDPQLSEKIADINSDLTLSFLPYVPHLEEQTRHAYENGNEVMLHMPMDTHGDRWDSEPDMLKRSMSNWELKQIFSTALNKSDYFSGVNNHLGSGFTEDFEKMTVLMKVLKEQYPDLYFIDSRTTPRTVAEQVAKENGILSEMNNVFLDHEQTREYTIKQLNILLDIAKRDGHAIAIGHPHETTLTVLEEFIQMLDTSRYDFVHASEVVTLQ